MTSRRKKTKRREGGFTLIEMMMAGTLLTIGACGLSVTLLSSMSLARSNSETARAATAVRQVVEQMRSVPSSEIFAVYNSTPSDDPIEFAVVPGDVFSVETNSGQYYVQVIFPTNTSGTALREDVNDPLLGMPRDLDGSGEVDSTNHADDYVLLPARIRVTWDGVNGRRSFEMCTTFLNRP